MPQGKRYRQTGRPQILPETAIQPELTPTVKQNSPDFGSCKYFQISGHKNP